MLEVKWKEELIKCKSQDKSVSILVMLEVKWKVSDFQDIKERERCFNPCYVGSKMERWVKGLV